MEMCINHEERTICIVDGYNHRVQIISLPELKVKPLRNKATKEIISSNNCVSRISSNNCLSRISSNNCASRIAALSDMSTAKIMTIKNASNNGSIDDIDGKVHSDSITMINLLTTTYPLKVLTFPFFTTPIIIHARDIRSLLKMGYFSIFNNSKDIINKSFSDSEKYDGTEVNEKKIVKGTIQKDKLISRNMQRLNDQAEVFIYI
jgi:hypothetical protein